MKTELEKAFQCSAKLDCAIFSRVSRTEAANLFYQWLSTRLILIYNYMAELPSYYELNKDGENLPNVTFTPHLHVENVGSKYYLWLLYHVYFSGSKNEAGIILAVDNPCNVDRGEILLLDPRSRPSLQKGFPTPVFFNPMNLELSDLGNRWPKTFVFSRLLYKPIRCKMDMITYRAVAAEHAYCDEEMTDMQAAIANNVTNGDIFNKLYSISIEDANKLRNISDTCTRDKISRNVMEVWSQVCTEQFLIELKINWNTKKYTKKQILTIYDLGYRPARGAKFDVFIKICFNNGKSDYLPLSATRTARAFKLKPVPSLSPNDSRCHLAYLINTNLAKFKQLIDNYLEAMLLWSGTCVPDENNELEYTLFVNRHVTGDLTVSHSCMYDLQHVTYDDFSEELIAVPWKGEHYDLYPHFLSVLFSITKYEDVTYTVKLYGEAPYYITPILLSEEIWHIEEDIVEFCHHMNGSVIIDELYPDKEELAKLLNAMLPYCSHVGVQYKLSEIGGEPITLPSGSDMTLAYYNKKHSKLDFEAMLKMKDYTPFNQQ